MDGLVSWPQLLFAVTLVMSSFAMAGWVLFRLTSILVRLEQLATKDDLSSTKRDLYARLDLQWNNWMDAHGALRERVSILEEQVKGRRAAS